jgi:HK97 gp10 family phage protein
MAVTFKGLDQALAYIKKKETAMVEAVKDVLANTATDVEKQAIASAPSQWEGFPLNIKQKIDKKSSNNGLLWQVGVDVPTSGEQWEAWMEFGTGLSAREILSNPQYSQEVRTIARTYYRNGKGRIVGQPYLMPAFYRNSANLVTEMVNEINKALK